MAGTSDSVLVCKNDVTGAVIVDCRDFIRSITADAVDILRTAETKEDIFFLGVKADLPGNDCSKHIKEADSIEPFFVGNFSVNGLLDLNLVDT